MPNQRETGIPCLLVPVMARVKITDGPYSTAATLILVHYILVGLTPRTVAVTVCVCVCVCVQFFPDRFVRREILNFKVICTNHSLGCPWEGVLSDYEVRAHSANESCACIYMTLYICRCIIEMSGV